MTDPLIALDPEDWHWAAWRDLPPVPAPVSRPFDRAATLEQLLALAGGKEWFPHDVVFPVPRACDPEEAHFWVSALVREHAPARQQLERLRAARLDERKFPDELHAIFERQPELFHANVRALAPLLATLLGLEGAVRFAFAHGRKLMVGSRLLHLPPLLTALKRWVFPFRTRQELAALETLVEKMESWPEADPAAFESPDAPFHYYLGAYLGTHSKEIEALADSWQPGQFMGRKQPLELIFGLRDPELVEHHTRRLALEPTGHQVHAWLAHTEARALDVPMGPILEWLNNPYARRRVEPDLATLALVRRPEVVPHLLEVERLEKKKTPKQIASEQSASGIPYGGALRTLTGWFQQNPEVAIEGAIPAAGGTGVLAKYALERLTELVNTKLGGQLPPELLEKASPKVRKALGGTPPAAPKKRPRPRS